MRAPDTRFSVRWAVATVILEAIVAGLAAIERMDYLRSKAAIARAETAYRSAKLDREVAETAVRDFAEGTFRRELATVEAEIKQAEGELSDVATDATAFCDWAERGGVRQKDVNPGWLHRKGDSTQVVGVSRASAEALLARTVGPGTMRDVER
jgi:hypothetical protein